MEEYLKNHLERRDVPMDAQIESLKELILSKFDEMEKQLKLKDDNLDLKFEAIVCKNSEQDSRLSAIENKETNFWQDIKKNVAAWIIPVILFALYFWATSGMPLSK